MDEREVGGDGVCNRDRVYIGDRGGGVDEQEEGGDGVHVR